MTPNELQEAILARIKELPDELLQEVYDFAEFLSERKNRTPDSPDAVLSESNQSEAAHLEEEFSDYRNRHPNE